MAADGEGGGAGGRDGHESDKVRRFVFESLPVRGQLVDLSESWRAALAAHRYAIPVRETLGEAMAASALLASTLKFDGRLTLQVTGEGPLRMLVVQCRSDLSLRAMASADERAREAGSFRELVAGGRLVLNLEMAEGRRYQGIVALERPSFVANIENYFANSEQLPTRLWLSADRQRVVGLLLQQMPLDDAASEGDRVEAVSHWHRLQGLVDAAPPDELLRHGDEGLLRRLFSGDDVRLFAPAPVRFHCGCSRERIEQVLQLMGREEVEATLASEGTLAVTCDFCGRGYAFDAVDAEAVLTRSERGGPGGDTTVH